MPHLHKASERSEFDRYAYGVIFCSRGLNEPDLEQVYSTKGLYDNSYLIKFIYDDSYIMKFICDNSYIMKFIYNKG